MKISEIIFEADTIKNPLNKGVRQTLQKSGRTDGGAAAGKLHAMTGDPLGFGARQSGSALDQSNANVQKSMADMQLSASKPNINKKEMSTAISGAQGAINKMVSDKEGELARQGVNTKDYATNLALHTGRSMMVKQLGKAKKLLDK
jgi:hypothetical protein